MSLILNQRTGEVCSPEMIADTKIAKPWTRPSNPLHGNFDWTCCQAGLFYGWRTPAVLALSGERYTSISVIATSASRFITDFVDAREGPHRYGQRHAGIFTSKVEVILVLIHRQAHLRCPSLSRQRLRERLVSLIGEEDQGMQHSYHSIRLEERPMNTDWVLYNLREAAKELSRMVSDIETTPDYGYGEFFVAMQHLYHHVNTAWNGRDASPQRVTACLEEDFDAWRRFPTDIQF